MAIFDAAETAASRISSLVLHEIGPNVGDFKLFNGTVDPGEMQDFFLAQLVTANKGSAYEFAPASAVAALLQTVRDHEGALETAGKAIATRFNELHRGNVNPGTLIFQLASPTRTIYAVIKFDSQRVVAVDEGADVHARLSLLRKTIVESKDAMQMSALIRLSDNGGALAVRARTGSRRIADYFVAFLGVERSFTEAELTSNLSGVLRATATEQRDHIDPQVFSELPTRIYDAVQNFATFDPEEDNMLRAVRTSRTRQCVPSSRGNWQSTTWSTRSLSS